MSSTFKRNERSKGVKLGDRTDRISSLPDKVLGHILSFLPTKHAVGTSILSRRWQNLFTLITNLDFDETLMFDPRRSQNYQELLQSRLSHGQSGLENLKLSSSFKDFVDRVMMLCKSPDISKFRLKCRVGFDCSNLNTWIRVALSRGITDLDISTYEFNSSVLPLSLFTSETLVVLKLRGAFEMKFPTSFQLPHLKLLHLFDLEFSDEDCSLNRFIAGCPELEDLVVGGSWKDVKVINISSSKLRRLTMDFTDGFTYCYHRTTVVLDLPNLVYFNYIDYLAEDYCLNNLNSLEEARIDVLLDIDNMIMESETFCTSILSLINGLSNAKYLSLSGKCVEALTCGEYTLPVLPKLSRLELGWSQYIYWRGVLCAFLQSSPVLEHLIFPEGLQHGESDSDDDNEDDDNNDEKAYWRKQRGYPCLSSHLKTITLNEFNGSEEELKIAKYFLQHGKVLKKMIIEWEIVTTQEYQELKKLLNIKRASPECCIELTRSFASRFPLW